MKSVYILWQRNGWVEADWRVLSLYSCLESARTALQAMQKIYPEDKGFEHKSTEMRVQP